MNIAFYTGASGLRAYQNQIDTIANNVSNVNTFGYKADKASFRDLIYTSMNINKNRELADDEQVLTGHGVQYDGQNLMYSQGVLYNSGYALDFAIAGDGLFAVQRDGRTEYTRNGSFDMSVEGNSNYLVTSDGAYVLDSYGNRITVPYDEQTHEIDNASVAQKIGVFNFENPYGLMKTDDISFLPTEISGEAQAAGKGSYKIYTSSLERSNTNIADEMADLIVSQKAYQFSARVVTAADEVEQIVNSLRG